MDRRRGDGKIHKRFLRVNAQSMHPAGGETYRVAAGKLAFRPVFRGCMPRAFYGA